MLRALPLVAACLVVLVAATPAVAQSPRTLYSDGPSGRYLLDGPWRFRADPSDAGLRQGWQRSASTAGWSAVEVPHAWNVGDHSTESMRGGVGWYRRDFKLPDADARLAWLLRFESVNYRARAWLNGRPIGRHAGAYLPFELAARGVRRKGTNRLVVRVDSRRGPADFPPATTSAQGLPMGGWWNYGGLLREVYLRRVDTVDLRRVRVEPRLACSACDARVRFEATLRNLTGRAAVVAVEGRFGARRLRLGVHRVPPRGQVAVKKSLVLRDPRLWSPADPYLYRASVSVRRGGRRLASHALHSGVRSVRVSRDGRLILNGRYANLRGVGYHEDTRERGFAVTNADREWLVAEAQALGATIMRTHYPPHPYLHELADRRGMLLWSEIPVYAMKTSVLARAGVRRSAYALLRRNVLTNRNHPSVAIWSIANELSSRPGPAQGAYIRRATRVARKLDPARPVGIAVAGYPSSGCQTEYAPLDVIGINEYFGWYPGPGGQLFDRTRLPEYLESVRRCYPRQAIMVTEFGAEANRDGPVEEKGTWLHQQDFVGFHLGVFDRTPWLSGALYWALNEFRVRPGWEGGNPRPQPPIHQKGLVTYERVRKPAWTDAQRMFKATEQLTATRRR